MNDAGKIYRHFYNRFPVPETESLRIWWIPQLPGKAFEWPVKDIEQAALLLDALAAYDDFQFAEHIKGDYSNTGGLNFFDGSEWVDWEDKDGDDFDTWRSKDVDQS